MYIYIYRENTNKNDIIPNKFRPWLFQRDIVGNMIYCKILCYMTSVGLCKADF